MKRIAVIVMGGALVLAGCQSASEVLTEQVIEQVEGVVEVEIDTESGQISIETDEGTVSVGTGELPDGFPIPIPDDGDIFSVLVIGPQASVIVEYPEDRYDELVTFYNDWTAQQPGEWTSFSGENQLGRVSNWSVTDSAGGTLSIGLSDCSGGVGSDEGVCLNLYTAESTG